MKNKGNWELHPLRGSSGQASLPVVSRAPLLLSLPVAMRKHHILTEFTAWLSITDSLIFPLP